MTELYLEKPQDYLHLEYSLKKERRPAYSLRAFARDLQMSPTSLVDILKGKQGLSEDRARSVAKILKWTPERYQHFWNLLQANFAADPIRKKNAQKAVKLKLKELKAHISIDKFKLISDWHHLAILTYLQMSPQGSQENLISESLGIGNETIRDSLVRMKKLGLVTLDKKIWKASTENVHSGNGGPSDAVRAYHHQILDQTHQALENIEIDRRDNISVIYSMEEKMMPAIHRDIQQAVLNVLNEYSQKSKDDSVQILTLHMFPVTRNGASPR